MSLGRSSVWLHIIAAIALQFQDGDFDSLRADGY
jgi:hypothetical protein